MFQSSFRIEVVTPERVIYSADATSVTAPGAEGYFGVMSNHLPMVVELGVGKLTIQETSGRTMLMALDGGFFEVCENRAVVLADGAVLSTEIDVEGNRRLLEEAQRALSDLDDPSIDRERMRRQLTRAEAKLHVVTDSQTKH